MAHTPGPWEARVDEPNDGRNSAVYAGIHSKEWVIADVYHDTEELEDAAAANAALISAAPDLLSALKALRAAAENSVYNTAPTAEMLHAYEQADIAARAAIRKAQGK